MSVNVQFHASAVLSAEKEYPLLFEHEAEYDSQPV
jgi:hypothetical protein